MAVKTVLALDIEPFKKSASEAGTTLQNVASKSAKALNQIRPDQAGRELKSLPEKVSKGASAVSGLSAAIGGINPQLGMVAQGVGALVSGPIALLTAAIGGGIMLGIKVWDELTLSTEEYTEKLDRAAAAARKHREEVEKQSTAAQSYLDRLKTLSESEVSSNSAKSEMASLIQKLTAEYGDLGIKIDDVINKTADFDKAQEKLDKQVAKKRVETLSGELDETKRQSGNAEKLMFRQTGGFRQQLASLFGLADNDAMHVSEAKREYHNLDTPEDQLQYLKDKQDQSKTKADSDAIQKAIELKEREIEQEKQLKMLRSTGSSSEAEQAARELAKSEAANKMEAASKRQNDLVEQTVSQLEEAKKLQEAIAAGKELEYRQTKAIRDLEKSLGRGLGYSETERLKGAVKENYDSEKAKESSEKEKEKAKESLNAEIRAQQEILSGIKLGSFGDEIKTNALTARGGWSSGASVSATEPNQKIMEYTQKITTTLDEIKRLQAKGNLV